MLAVLHRRLARFDGRRLARRAGRGEQAVAALAPAVDVPGRHQNDRTWWLFAVAVECPASLVGQLRASGFDASPATSALAAVPAPVGPPEADPVVARDMLSRVVCLPIYPELPAPAFRRLLAMTATADVER